MAVDAPPRAAYPRVRSGVRRSLQQRTDPTTAVEAVRRGMVSAAVLWQVLWLLAQPGLWPGAQRGPGAVAAMWVVVGFAALLLIAHLLARGGVATRIARADAVILLAATVVVNASQARTGMPDWHLVAELAALASGISGLLLTFRWAVASTAAMTLLLLRDVMFPDWSGVIATSVDGLLDPVYVMAVGLSSAFVARVLRAQAVAADSASDALLLTERERRAAESVELAMRATERRLHETVLNTLVALARGGVAPTMGARLTERCREGARMLSSLIGRSTSVDSAAVLGAIPRREPRGLSEVIEPVLEDLRAAGIQVSTRFEGTVTLPGDVLDAVQAASIEALINVGRHADASRVDVTVVATAGTGIGAVDVRIWDDGRGLPAVLPENRFGLTDVILGPMVDVGGTAEITSQEGEGTVVTLAWQPGTSRRPAPGSFVDPAPSALAFPVLVALGIYSTVLVAGTWDTAEQPAFNGVAFGLLVAVGTIVALLSRRGRLGWPALVAVGLLGWGVYLLEEAAAWPGMPLTWASPSIAAVFLVAAAIGPRWGWVFLLAVWLVFQGDPLHEITQPGTAMILVGALLGRSLRRNARVAWQRRQEEAEAAIARQVARGRIEGLNERYGALTLSAAPELLNDIAEGRCDPADDRVRARAAREERFIRNVMRTDPMSGAVEVMARQLICLAHERDVLLDLDLSAPRDLPVSIDEAVVASLTHVVRRAAPTVIVDGQPVGSPARLSTRTEGDSVMLRLLVPMAVDPGADSSRSPLVALHLVDPSDEAGAVWLCEAALPMGGSL